MQPGLDQMTEVALMETGEEVDLIGEGVEDTKTSSTKINLRLRRAIGLDVDDKRRAKHGPLPEKGG